MSNQAWHPWYLNITSTNFSDHWYTRTEYDPSDIRSAVHYSPWFDIHRCFVWTSCHMLIDVPPVLPGLLHDVQLSITWIWVEMSPGCPEKCFPSHRKRLFNFPAAKIHASDGAPRPVHCPKNVANFVAFWGVSGLNITESNWCLPLTFGTSSENGFGLRWEGPKKACFEKFSYSAFPGILAWSRTENATDVAIPRDVSTISKAKSSQGSLAQK
jgi:hypothetical protein